jgi:uncharacterized membrane protein YqaE (UPF0057 family)
MNKLKYTLGIIAFISVFASCSVEKRVHRNGYHVEWHGRNKQVEQTASQPADKDLAIVEHNDHKDPEVQPVAIPQPTVEHAAAPAEIEKEVKSDLAKNTPTKRQARKEVMQSLSPASKSNLWNGHTSEVSHSIDASETDSQTDQLVCVIVALFLPFLGVYLYQGDITQDFWITLVLSLFFYFPGLFYGLYVILLK